MPLSALIFYIESKYKHEIKHDAYLFNSLQALLTKKPDQYYPKYPSWTDDIVNAPKRERKKVKKRTFDDVMDGILAKL